MADHGMGCPVCDGASWSILPGTAQAMLSDGRLLTRPLIREMCCTCGLARLIQMPGAEEQNEVFTENSVLYAHAIGGTFERRRQQQYARWIRDAVGAQMPTIVFEAGCGNGSLLSELSAFFPRAKLTGIDPSTQAVAYARMAGVDARVGYLDENTGKPGGYDLVISVNVLEHVPDPLAFLTVFASLIGSGGKGVLICPDGDIPSTELLFLDHLYSFNAQALVGLCERAGMQVLSRERAPAELGGFQRVVVVPATAPRTHACGGEMSALLHLRRAYFLSWIGLQRALLARIPPGNTVVCFGTGEAASLLAAYAPDVWERIGKFTVDEPEGAVHAGRPLVKYGDIAHGQAILLAVHPASQAGLAHRLQQDGHKPLRWDDLVMA